MIYNFLKVSQAYGANYSYDILFKTNQANEHIVKGNNIIYDGVAYEIIDIDTVYGYSKLNEEFVIHEVNVYVKEKDK